MTTKAMSRLGRAACPHAAVLLALMLVAGCGDGKDGAAPAAPVVAPMPSEAARKADAERLALSARLEAVDKELAAGVADAGRREKLLEEQKRLSVEVKEANREKLRRDREEVRRMISEKNRKKEGQK